MFVIVTRGRGREKNYRDRARGRDSCAVRTKPVAAFTSRQLAPRETSTFREFSKRQNEIKRLGRRLFTTPTAC